ncbi:HlyD family secretion protein [Gynuella sp.]|uniref:HlyD family secretion protein n=1 Tax=Gynuella sp. TaxID=2969146 RepID=UPI003D0C9260
MTVLKNVKSDQDIRFKSTDKALEEKSSEQEEQVETRAMPEQKRAGKRKHNVVMPLIMLLVLGAGGWYGYQWWTEGRFMVSTDDAYIEGDIAIISPKVTGYVDEVNVKANQRVKAGDVLVTLDNGDYRIAAEQTDASINSQNLAIKSIDARIVGANASLEQAKAAKLALQAKVHIAELTVQRASRLQEQAYSTQSSLDSANASLDEVKAELVGADANIEAARANISVLTAQRNEAVAALKSLQLSKEQAERNLAFTVLKAPYDGTIGNLSVQKGDLVSAGASLASLVPANDLYIEANFKETQIDQISPGEKVKIHVDAFGSMDIEGRVESLSPASGSVFSVLPAENATGNFTKVVQRIPVRIGIPRSELDKGYLRAGLSVVVDIDTRTATMTSLVNVD